MPRNLRRGSLRFAVGGYTGRELVGINGPKLVGISDPNPPSLMPAPLSPDAPNSQMRGTELSNLDYQNYGFGPEHNFFPGQRDFGPLAPIVHDGGGFTIPTKDGGSSPSWVDQAIGLAGLIKTGKGLYDTGKDIYNRYENWRGGNQQPNGDGYHDDSLGRNIGDYFDTAGLGLGAYDAYQNYLASTPQGSVSISDVPDYDGSGQGGGGGSGGGGPGGYGGAAAVGAGALAGSGAPAGTVAIQGLGADEAAALGSQAGASGAGGAGASGTAGTGASLSGALGWAARIYGLYEGIKGSGAAYRSGDATNGMVSGATTGASVGSIGGPVGTAAGAIIGGALGALYAGSSSATTESNTEKSAWSQFNKNPTANYRNSGFPTTAAFDGAMRTDNDKDPVLLKAIGDKRGDNSYPSSFYMTSYLKNAIRQAQADGRLPPDGQLSSIDGKAFFEKEILPQIYGPNGAPKNDKIRNLLGTMTDEIFAYGASDQGKLGTADFTRTNSSGNTYFDEAAARASGQHARGGLARYANGGRVGMIPRRGALSVASRPMPGDSDTSYYTYGVRPQPRIPATMPMGQPPMRAPVRPMAPLARAAGGLGAGSAGNGTPRGARLVRGPGTGRSDDIPAVLSDGEYVMDAETVALLGDGSTDEGARRLDALRKKLRMQKGKQLSKGKFSSKAKQPEEYLE